MRFAGYNIQSGGYDGYDHEALSPPRLSDLQLAIKTLGAEIVGLSDTFRWDADQLRDSFSYEHTAHAPLEDKRLGASDNGVGLLSHHPLQDIEAVSLGTRNALRATATTENGPVDIMVAYLDDLSEDTRLAQTDALLDHIKNPARTIIMGDLNSVRVSPERRLGRATAMRLVAAKLQPVIRDMHRGEVIRRFEEFGFIDAGSSENQPTWPTKKSPYAFKGAVPPFLAIDHILTSPHLHATKCEVPDEAVFHRAADHLPIVAEVDM